MGGVTDKDAISVPPPDPIPTVADGRATIELEQLTNLATHRYSVRRATTNDEHSQMIEHVAVGRVVTPPPRPQWRVELGDRSVTIWNDHVQVELPIEDARRIAEAILKHR
jgi:hypothetical protein